MDELEGYPFVATVYRNIIGNMLYTLDIESIVSSHTTETNTLNIVRGHPHTITTTDIWNKWVGLLSGRYKFNNSPNSPEMSIYFENSDDLALYVLTWAT